MTHLFLGNWVTRFYSIAVLISIIVMIAAYPVVGFGFAAVFLIGLTAPVSIIFAPFFLLGEGWLTVPMMIGSVVAGYLLNTVLLNMIAGQVEKVGARRA